VGAKLRVYHQDYKVTWADRVYDFFSGHTMPRRVAGVDYTLLNRASLRAVREFLDGVSGIQLLGDEMVRIDSTWRLAEDAEARRCQAEGLTSRLRVGQVQAGSYRTPLAARWFQYEDLPGGTRLLVRLLDAPNPNLRTFVSGNVNEDEGGAWMEYAVGL
jgi:hypothetical protein